ncbi:MAG TPA: matrixin family metalloprotease [Gemmatimonadaceae bacterium]|nr:matrixin family metalloprotease [Gemmatimonadaceae bacterium]
MKRPDILLTVVALPILGFVFIQAIQTPKMTSLSQAAALEPASRVESPARAATTVRVAAGMASPRLADSSGAAAMAPARDVEEIRDRLRRGASGTYIDEILLARDSALARWPERVARPIRVWIGAGSSLNGWDNDFVARVRSAFDEWSLVGIPVRFVFVVDSSDAEVKVRWIDEFKEPISGKTLWARDRNGWIMNGNITLALRHDGGEALDARAVKAIALHEVGHLLGLDHTNDTSNIMTPRVRVRDLSEADRATVLLLYSVPPGSIKG